eukprot:gnl/TRDRNA2_/TRDRNA2_137811_c0_seq1.p1 gnl/TRDRNA2_/TRDRNA2_137811_c0~~gnl/TRDRNA2_/TRDRNA2_137811_c0_seq1.p1  ORF type:complete len:237 (-),score=29.06 gnl/TRDRNA2_/TRDRNA2_137811_c0_seq1:192-842(-)
MLQQVSAGCSSVPVFRQLSSDPLRLQSPQAKSSTVSENTGGSHAIAVAGGSGGGTATATAGPVLRRYSGGTPGAVQSPRPSVLRGPRARTQPGQQQPSPAASTVQSTVWPTATASGQPHSVVSSLPAAMLKAASVPKQLATTNASQAAPGPLLGPTSLGSAAVSGRVTPQRFAPSSHSRSLPTTTSAALSTLPAAVQARTSHGMMRHIGPPRTLPM